MSVPDKVTLSKMCSCGAMFSIPFAEYAPEDTTSCPKCGTQYPVTALSRTEHYSFQAKGQR